MKSQRTRTDLIETVVKQMEVDFHCADVEAIEELINFVPVENLVAYLPEEDWRKFRHLVAEEHLAKDEEHIEIRTENALRNLVNTHPNDADLGEQIRIRYGRNN